MILPEPFNLTNGPSILGYAYNLEQSINDDSPIVINTGTSTSIIPFLSDFVGKLQLTELTEVKQLHGNTKNVGKGMVECEVLVDYWNVVKLIQNEVYYIPDACIIAFLALNTISKKTHGGIVWSQQI